LTDICVVTRLEVKLDDWNLCILVGSTSFNEVLNLLILFATLKKPMLNNYWYIWLFVSID